MHTMLSRILFCWALVLASGLLSAQRSFAVVSTWNATPGNWSNSSKWSTEFFPNNGNGGLTYDAVVTGGSVNLDQGIVIDGLTFSGGTITGSNNLELLTTLNWTAGTFTGNGTTKINNGAISEPGNKFLEQRTLQIVGHVNWTAGEILSSNQGKIDIESGGVFTAGGTTNRALEADVVVDSGGAFLNTGSRFTDIAGFLVNNGIVELQADSALFVSGGSGNGDLIIGDSAIVNFILDDAEDYQFTGHIILDGGVFDILVFGGGGVTFLLPTLLSGNGVYQTNGGVLVNSTELAPGFSVGHIDILGDYEQTSTGQLSMEVEGPNPGQFDTVDIQGEAMLGGILEVTIDDAANAPPGTMIELLTAGSIGGTFESVLTEGADDIYFAPIYDVPGSFSVMSVLEGDMDPFTPGIGEEDAVAFALALTDPDTYFSTYGVSADEAGDIDDIGDRGLDFDDIDDFVELLNRHLNGGMTMSRMFQLIKEAQSQVPEPNGVALGLVAALLTASSRFKRNSVPAGKCPKPVMH